MLFNYIPGTNQALIGTDNTPLLMYDDQTTLLGANNDGITDAIEMSLQQLYPRAAALVR